MTADAVSARSWASQQMEVENEGYHHLLLLQMWNPDSKTLHVRTTAMAVTWCAHDDEMEDGSDSDGSRSDVLVHVHAASLMFAETENSQVNHHLPLHLHYHRYYCCHRQHQHHEH